MNAQPQNKEGITPKEYLEFEKTSETRHEYFDGEIFAMVGATLNHNQISGNIFGELRNQLKQSPCRAFVNDLRVKVQEIDKYTYPDIVVACGDIELEKEIGMETLINPLVIIEVLSDSTEAYDRGIKFQHYRLISSLKEYILVSQHSCLVEKFVRSNGEKWLYSTYEEMDKTMIIEAVQCEIALSEVYRWVNFKADF
ncbi:MAG: Uma2 family endonuclease [Desulfamplus sp.]|nr:Uma2 family endonuclease [Desulfamplus sp.]